MSAKVKVIYGDPDPGSVRVMVGSEQVPGVQSVEIPKTKTGDLPKIEVTFMTASLEVEDRNPKDAVELTEKTVNVSKPVGKQIPNTVKKPSK